MDYSAVAPPSQAASADPQSAFADALARARQIAAKINTSADSEQSTLKRPFEGTPDSQPDTKKAAMNDPIGAQLKAIADQQRAQQAAQAAASAAAQINAKLGIQSNPSNPPLGGVPGGQPGLGGGPGMSNNFDGGNTFGGGAGNFGMVQTDHYSVPDIMVGLVIGKGGEHIATIQAETGVKVQFAPDSGGAPDRPCTLTGTPDGIVKAKEMIQKIISKGQGMPDPAFGDGAVMEEVMIPGSKVGLVIGKGGENIKQLQAKANVKMVMIQDSNAPSHIDKPLRITGDPPSVAKAKGLVFDLLAEKEAQAAAFGGNEFGGGGGGGGGRGGMEIPVPRNLVGVVIGKGGDMIKNIQTETGARVQFKPDDGNGPDRLCSVSGSPEKVQAAAEFIQNLLNSAMANGNDDGRGRGRGRGGGMSNGRPGGGQFGSFGRGDAPEETFTVPADKTGLIIGKGGETIREINRQSNAHVELCRDAPPNPRERIFRIRGSPDEIKEAIKLMCEKAGLPIPPDNGGGNGGFGGQFGGPGGGGSGGQFGGPGGQGGGGPNYGGPGGPPNQPGGQGGPGGPPGGPAPQGWSNAYQQWSQGPQDPGKQGDQNAQAWAQYYQQYYNPNQPGQPGQPQAPQQPQQQQPAPHQQPQQPQIQPVTGQPDYSAAWAEYYRSQGMHAHANAIMAHHQQMQGGGMPGQPGGGGPPQQQPGGPGGQPHYGGQ